MARNLGRVSLGKWKGTAFFISESAIESGKLGANVDYLQPHSHRTLALSPCLSALDQQAPNALALACGLNREQSEITLFGVRLNINAACQATGILSQQEYTLPHQFGDLAIVGPL